jgi:hypothetical protein
MERGDDMRVSSEHEWGAGRRAATAVLMVGVAWACSGDPTTPEPDPDPEPVANQAPSALAGADRTASVGLAVLLDGSGSSDPDGDALTYAWALTTPDGSAASLDDATTATPSFLPDVEGAYVASLGVNDGEEDGGPDEVTVTAVDNSAAVVVSAAAGGTVASTSSALSMAIPAGALGADTEIRITEYVDGQRPSAAESLTGEVTAFDLQPSGLAFATPAEVTLEMPGAVTEDADGVSLTGAVLLSESGGVIEAMTDVTTAQDEADPTKATITGGLAHFSAAMLVVSSMEFRIDLPTEARVGEPFDVTTTVDITGAGLGDVASATVEDVSVAPVAPDAGFATDLQGSGTVWTVTNSYVCDAVGEGRVRANVRFDATDDYGSFANVQLGKAVACTEPPPPLGLDFVSLWRARRLMPIPGSSTTITVGGAVRTVNLQTATGTELDEAQQEWVNALSDESYLVYSGLGHVRHFDPNRPPGEPTPVVSPYDQPRHMQPVGPDLIALASAFGDLGLIHYQPGGGFVDRYRDLTEGGGPQQNATNLQAVWASPEGQTILGAVTEGDGDSAFEDTDMAILVPNDETGAIDRVPLPGIIDYIVDFDARHQMDLECRELGSQLFLCVFTAGFAGPAFDSALEDQENDGYVAIFYVDAFQQTTDLVYFDNGNARVGGAVFPLEGEVYGVAVANQHTGAIDLWRIGEGGPYDPIPVPLDGRCPHPIDLVSIDDGRLTALACQTPSVSLDSGVLVVRNLPGRAEPGS